MGWKSAWEVFRFEKLMIVSFKHTMIRSNTRGTFFEKVLNGISEVVQWSDAI